MTYVLRKPARWALKPGLVAPEWRWFWDAKENSTIIAPNTDVQPWDFGQRRLLDYDDVAGADHKVVDSVYGPAIRFNSITAAETDNSGYHITKTADFLGGASAFTVAAFIRRHAENPNTNNNGILMQDANGPRIRYRYDESANRWEVQVTINATVKTVLAAGDFASVEAGDWTAAAVTYDGAEVALWQNGIKIGQTPASGPTDTGGAESTWISQAGGSADAGSWDVLVLTAQDKFWGEERLIEWSRNFFGPFRMADDISIFDFTVLFTSANLALHHSGASDIGGAIGAILTDDQLNNIWDDVSSADASAGDTEYRCTYVKNDHGSLSTTNGKVEILTDPTQSNFEIGLGAAGKNGTETAIANEDTAPGGVSFGTIPLNLGTLAAGDFYPIWIKRIVSVGAGAATPDSGVLRISGDDPN